MNISKQISCSFLVRDDPREGAMCYGKLEKFGSCKKKNLFVTPSLPTMIIVTMIMIVSLITMMITMINIIMMLFLILIYQKLLSHVTN